jgi:hypothetical protein
MLNRSRTIWKKKIARGLLLLYSADIDSPTAACFP